MWIDITMPLSNLMAVWPGDTQFQYKLDTRLDTDGANVGQIQMSLHAGTHVDAPYHYDNFGKAVDSLPLDLFIGHVKIVHVPNDVKQITLQFVEKLQLEGVRRLFFKTKETYDFLTFEEQFVTFEPTAILYLKKQGVDLIGTDAPSIDPIDDIHLQAHHACRSCNMIVVENLYLKNVLQGDYEFIGLPLAIQGGDASPIRAVIRKCIEAKQHGE